MNTYMTLWDALRNDEAQVVVAVEHSVTEGLAQFATDIKQLSWANSNAADDFLKARAAA